MVASESSQRGLPLLVASTRAFIDDDPVDIALIPGHATRVETPSGGYEYEDAAPRPTQTFKMINASGGDFNGRVSGDGLESIKFSYVILGMPDAEIAVGDWWADGDNRYRITGILHKNDYEVKATVESFGPEPNYG